MKKIIACSLVVFFTTFFIKYSYAIEKAKNKKEESELSLSKKNWLIGDWRSQDGVWIAITKKGDFYLKKDANIILAKGKIELLYYYQHSDGELIDIFIAKISFNGTDAIVPVCFYSGEGDPCRLHIYQLQNELGYQLEKYYKIKQDEKLILSSPGPYGNWPEYIGK